MWCCCFALRPSSSERLCSTWGGGVYESGTTHAVSMFAGIIRDNVGQYQEECSNLNSLCSAPTAAQSSRPRAPALRGSAGKRIGFCGPALVSPLVPARSHAGVQRPQKSSPAPRHPPQSSNTCPRLRGPSLTRGYPAARHAESSWIPDMSARAGLRGDFQRSQTTVGLAGHFALNASQ